MSQSFVVTALLLTLLTAAPIEGRFVLEIGGLPVAELRVTATGDRYVYESTHFLEEGPREHRIELALDGKAPVPEVLALLRRPASGCHDVMEERTRATEQLCVRKSTAHDTYGTIAGQPFIAHYEAGSLSTIKVGAARWSAVTSPTAPPLESPFVQGLAVPAGELQLEPALAGSSWLNRPPVGIGQVDRVGRARCLVLAREEAARRPKARVAVGLVIEAGRAYPHAWIVEGAAAFDPSVLPEDPVLAQRQYLEVPRERSGTFFLQLFEGAVRLKTK